MKQRSISPNRTAISLVVGTLLLLISAAALNGGIALAASAFDTLVATIKSMLSSTLVLSLTFVTLFAAVWQIFHGKGYALLSYVLGGLATAILGPAIVTGLATSTRTPTVMIVKAVPVATVEGVVIKAPSLEPK